MKRVLIGFLVFCFLAIGVTVQAEDVTVNVSLASWFSYTITFGSTTVNLTAPSPPVQDEDTWSGAITAEAVIEADAAVTRANLMCVTTDLIDGANTFSGGHLRLQGDGEWNINERGMPTTSTQVKYFEDVVNGVAGTYTGNIQIGYRSYAEDDTPGSYSATVTFILIAA